jgi:hypothetical protein
MSGSDDTDEAWTKAQRLVVAGAVAPGLRDAAERARLRRVARVDKDGAVVGYTTLDAVQAALLRRREIELSVADGVRPKEAICRLCGKTIRVGRLGYVPTKCVRGCKLKCDGCGGKIGERTSQKASRERRAALCHACTAKLGGAAMWARRSSEDRSASARRLQESMTREQRSEASRKQHAALSKEEAANIRRKGWVTRRHRGTAPPELRRAGCHPERKHLAKGLCKPCYDARRRREKKAASPAERQP